MEKFAFSIPHYTSLYFKQILFLQPLSITQVHVICDQGGATCIVNQWWKEQIWASNTRKTEWEERHSSGLLLFFQSSFHGKQYWFRFYGPLSLSNPLSVQLALPLPTWPLEKWLLSVLS